MKLLQSPRWIHSALLLLVALCASCTAPSTVQEAGPDPVTVYFVRHAETAASTKTTRDPKLSDAGRARADALAVLLAEEGVTHFFSSEYVRTAATIEPLARLAVQAIRRIPAGDSDAQLRALAALPPGSIAIVAGHSNTVPKMIGELGGEVSDLDDRGFLHHDVYERLFVVTLAEDGKSAASLVERRFGS